LQKCGPQLAADRELCGNSETAQAFLNLAETKLDEVETGWARPESCRTALDHVSLRKLKNGGEIGKDSATGDEIPELADDIRAWETALQTVPLEKSRLAAFFKIAEKSIALLKKNCIALADKSDLQDRMLAVFESTKNLRAELGEVDRLLQVNSDLKSTRIVSYDAPPPPPLAQQATIEMLDAASRPSANYLLLNDQASLEGWARDSIGKNRANPERYSRLETLPIRSSRSRPSVHCTNTASASKPRLRSRGKPGQAPADRVNEVVKAYESDLDNLLKSARYKKPRTV